MQTIYLVQFHLAPKFLMNRKYLLPLALLLFTFVLAACGGGEDFTAPNQPGLSLQAGEQSDTGLRTVACWPKGEKNVSCEFTNDAESPSPSTALAVQGGQAVTVAIANPEGVALPNQVVITSRETDAAGNPLFTMQIDPAQSAEFALALPSGRYLLDVTAYYADIEGSSATVSNVFAVDVGQAVAGNVTPEPTESVTPETTPEVTPEVTIEVTEVATEVVTPEATPEVTEEATAESTDIATVEATPEATEESSASGGNETETPIATEEAITPTAEVTETVEPTEVVTEPVSTEEAVTPEATESATPISPIVITPVASETATEVVTEAPTATPTEEVTEVVAPPTSTSTPTATPTTPAPTPITPTATPTVTATAGVSPTNTSVFDVDAPPAVTLRISGRNYQPVGYDYCRRNSSNELVCVKQPFTATGSTSTSIRAARNAAANIRIGGSRPSSVEINYLSRDTLQPIASETRVGDNVVLFNLGVSAGSYILSVEIVWPDDVTVTYYFQLQVLQ